MNGEVQAAIVPHGEDGTASCGRGRSWLEAGRAMDARGPWWSEQPPGVPSTDAELAAPGVWGARTGHVRLQPLRDQPLVDVRWGRLAGWIRDVALDPRARCVAALEVACAAEPRRWVAPFPLWRSRRASEALEADPELWQPVERAGDWIGLDALGGLVVVEADGDWTERVVDAEADPETWAIEVYLLRRSWWPWLRQPRLAPDRVLSSSPQLLIVQSRVVGPVGTAGHPTAPRAEPGVRD